MIVQVRIGCAPYSRQEVERALWSAGERLAATADSVFVKIDPEMPRVAVLEFEVRRTAQHKVVDRIYDTVKFWAMDFYEDITIRFSKE